MTARLIPTPNGFRMFAILSGLLGFYGHGPAATIDAAYPGFVDQQVANGLVKPTAMEFLPDGRILVCQQTGEVRVIQNGAVLATPFITFNTDSNGERGLLGVAVDPDFAANSFVYFYFTVPAGTVPGRPAPFHRVVRVTAAGNASVPGSEQVIFELSNLTTADNHNGGAIHFGPDGKLYIGTGENATSEWAQNLDTTHGKILRINKDGSIPADNPFFTQATGNARATWAMGLRNPFTFAFQRGTGRMHINDVGQNNWEEINLGVAGGNYGWPATEGAFSPSAFPQFINPLYAYPHFFDDRGGCSIAGGDFYNPPGVRFPPAWIGRYFFADLCTGWIRFLETPSNTSAVFARGVANPVDLRVGADGALYYLARGAGAVGRIQYAAPLIQQQPVSSGAVRGEPVTFTVTATGFPALNYIWRRNGGIIAGAVTSSYTIPAVATVDNGAEFSVEITNEYGSVTSNIVSLVVTDPPGFPDAPASPQPQNGLGQVPANAQLSWNAASNASSYDVYFGNSPSPPFVQNTLQTSYSPGQLTPGTLYYWRVVARNSNGATSSPEWTFQTATSGPAPGTGLRFVPIVPCRVVDTRPEEQVPAPLGAPALAAGATRTLALAQGRCGIPASARAYSLNVTVVPKEPLAYLTIWPSGQPQPLVSTLNSPDGQVVANAALVSAGDGGSVNVFAYGTTELILDINGYFVP